MDKLFNGSGSKNKNSSSIVDEEEILPRYTYNEMVEHLTFG